MALAKKGLSGAVSHSAKYPRRSTAEPTGRGFPLSGVGFEFLERKILRGIADHALLVGVEIHKLPKRVGVWPYRVNYKVELSLRRAQTVQNA